MKRTESPTWEHTRIQSTMSLWIALSVCATGCATIGTRTTDVRSRVTLIRAEEVPDDSIIFVDPVLKGSALRLKVVHSCRTRDVREIDRYDTIETFNQTPAKTWALGALAVAALGGGSWVIVDAKNVGASDESSRTYNPIGPAGAVAIGGTLFGVGLAAGVATVVDVVRASQTSEKKRPVLGRGDLGREIAPCTHHPAQGANLFLGPNQIALGVTGPDGSLEVDLDRTLLSEYVWKSNDLHIMFQEVQVAQVDGTDIARLRESRDWAALDRASCAEPQLITSCQSVEQFISRFPRGQRTQEAKAMLVDAAPKLRRLADEQMWSAIKDSACSKGTFATPDEGDSACSVYRDYLSEYSDGMHADEARTILASAAERATALEKQIETQRLQQQQRADEEARRAEAAERKACIGNCKVVCSSVLIRSHASCMAGCVESRCQE